MSTTAGLCCLLCIVVGKKVCLCTAYESNMQCNMNVLCRLYVGKLQLKWYQISTYIPPLWRERPWRPPGSGALVSSWGFCSPPLRLGERWAGGSGPVAGPQASLGGPGVWSHTPPATAGGLCGYISQNALLGYRSLCPILSAVAEPIGV